MSSPLTLPQGSLQQPPKSSTTYLPNILIAADTGAGKSTALEKLPQNSSTRIIETEGKALPFSHNFDVRSVNTIDEFDREADSALADPKVEIIVYDSLSKQLHRCLQMCRATMKGYDIWSGYGIKGFRLFKQMHSTSKIIIATSLVEVREFDDVNEQGSPIKIYKKVAATFMGKELESKIEPEFACVLHIDMKRVSGGIEHLFITKPDGVTTSKTPKAMFQGKTRIPNDIMLVIDELKKAKLVTNSNNS